MFCFLELMFCIFVFWEGFQGHAAGCFFPPTTPLKPPKMHLQGLLLLLLLLLLMLLMSWLLFLLLCWFKKTCQNSTCAKLLRKTQKQAGKKVFHMFLVRCVLRLTKKHASDKNNNKANLLTRFLFLSKTTKNT